MYMCIIKKTERKRERGRGRERKRERGKRRARGRDMTGGRRTETAMWAGFY